MPGKLKFAPVPRPEQAGLTIPDRDPGVPQVLELTRREDGTFAVLLVGKRGAVKGWIEISPESAATAGRYLIGE